MSPAAGTVLDSVQTETLSVLPLFILMGLLVSQAGLASELYRASNAFLGHRRGGLAMATVIACGGLQEAEATRELAFNQGFYNLFLAIAVVLGIALYAAGHHAVGATLVFTGAGSMAAAALVLILSSPDKRGAALKQGVVPAFGVAALAVGLLV